MKDFSELSMTVKSDATSAWISLRGTFPGYRDADKDARKPGLQSVWFVLTREELIAIVAGKVSAARDGMHSLNVSGERWTFYDLDLPSRESRGIAHVPYAHVNMPYAVQRLLLRWAKQVWAKQAAMRKVDARVDYNTSTEATLDLMPHVERWERKYGQGKGQVRLVLDTYAYSGPSTADMFAIARAMGGNFDEIVARLETMARNRTFAADETVDLPIYRDSSRADDPCFTWRAAGMFGGLVNHAKAGETPSWSLHT